MRPADQRARRRSHRPRWCRNTRRLRAPPAQAGEQDEHGTEMAAVIHRLTRFRIGPDGGSGDGGECGQGEAARVLGEASTCSRRDGALIAEHAGPPRAAPRRTRPSGRRGRWRRSGARGRGGFRPALAGPDHVAEPLEDAGGDLADQREGVRRLMVGQLAGEEPGKVRRLTHHPSVAVEQPGDGLERGQRGRQVGEGPPGKRTDAALEHRVIQPGLVGEVVIQERRVEAGLGTDGLDGGGGEALPGEQRLGGIEDAGIGGGGGHRP